MRVTVSVYDAARQLVFTHSDERMPCALVFIGGLTNGLLCVPYADALCARLASHGIAFVQPVLRSSYAGFGFHTLADDVSDLCALLRVLADRHGTERVVLCGYSTGCQDAVALLAAQSAADADGAVARMLAGIVLQAPVSDREYAATLPGTPALIAAAQALRDAGRIDDCVPRAVAGDAFPTPITARRVLSLCAARACDDDMFSSDLSDDELRACLAPLSRAALPTLIVWSRDDEYLPHGRAPAFWDAHVERLRAAIGAHASAVALPGDHALTGAEERAADAIAAHAARCCCE